MMNVNGKSGFALPEVLLALALIGLVIIPIFRLQSTFSLGIKHAAYSVEQVYAGSKILINNMLSLHMPDSAADDLSAMDYKKAAIGPESAFNGVMHLVKYSVEISESRQKRKYKKELLCWWYSQEAESDAKK